MILINVDLTMALLMVPSVLLWNIKQKVERKSFIRCLATGKTMKES